MLRSAKPAGKLVIFCGPSGSGKTTLVRKLLETIPELAFSVSAASRPARAGETNGKDYYFITADEFREKIRENLFLEWEEVYPDHFYGTLISEVDRIRAEGKNVIFDVDVRGALNIKKKYGNRALAVMVMPPSVEILERRLRLRSTESRENLKKRLDKALFELSFEPEFDRIVINDNLEDAVAEAGQIVHEFLKSSNI